MYVCVMIIYARQCVNAVETEISRFLELSEGVSQPEALPRAGVDAARAWFGWGWKVVSVSHYVHCCHLNMFQYQNDSDRIPTCHKHIICSCHPVVFAQLFHFWLLHGTHGVGDATVAWSCARSWCDPTYGAGVEDMQYTTVQSTIATWNVWEKRIDSTKDVAFLYILILVGKMTASLRHAIHFDSKPSVLQHTAMFPIITTLRSTTTVAKYPFSKCAKFARAVLGPCTLFLLLFRLFWLLKR